MSTRSNESSQMRRAQWGEAEAAAPSPPSSSSSPPPPVVSASPPSADPEPSLLELLQPVNSFFRLTSVDGGCDGLPGVAKLQASYAHRPLMELLSLAVLLDETVLHSMVEQSWIMNASACKPTCINKLEFDVAVGVEQLEETLTQLFVTEPCADAYEGLYAVREALLRRVAEAGKTQQLLQLRVPVTLNMTCFQNERVWVSNDGLRLALGVTDADYCERLPSPDQIVQLFEQVALMDQRVVQAQQCSSLAPCVQFALPTLCLTLDVCLPLTPDVVRAACALSQHSFVTVLHAKLDPRTILCSQDELTAYVKALSRHSTDLRIDTGDFAYHNRMMPIDGSGEDRKDVIVKIMTALASCSTLRSVDVSALLSLLSQPHNRLHFWQTLLEILLAPVPPVPDESSSPDTEFCLRLDSQLTDQDAVLIEQIPGLMTQRRRRVDQLNMRMFGVGGEASMLAVLSLVQDMESLDLGSDSANITDAAVSAILTASPKLRTLRLSNAMISSLDMFVDPTLSASGKCLEQITLICGGDITQSSITAFLTQLLDASTPLAMALRTLRIRSRGILGYEFDQTNAELLERVLCVNRRLEDVRVPIADDTPSTTRAALHAHNGDRVYGASQPPETVVSQRFAFLSVVRALGERRQVDPVIFRPVFGFAEPMLETRNVFVWAPSDGLQFFLHG